MRRSFEHQLKHKKLLLWEATPPKDAASMRLPVREAQKPKGIFHSEAFPSRKTKEKGPPIDETGKISSFPGRGTTIKKRTNVAQF